MKHTKGKAQTEKLRLLQDKIERAYKLQADQAFSTLTNGDNIDFKRANLIAETVAN